LPGDDVLAIGVGVERRDGEGQGAIGDKSVACFAVETGHVRVVGGRRIGEEAEVRSGGLYGELLLGGPAHHLVILASIAVEAKDALTGGDEGGRL